MMTARTHVLLNLLGISLGRSVLSAFQAPSPSSKAPRLVKFGTNVKYDSTFPIVSH